MVSSVRCCCLRLVSQAEDCETEFNAGHLSGAHLGPTPVEARGRKTKWAEGELGCGADPTAMGALC